jgi:hypothetical protein
MHSSDTGEKLDFMGIIHQIFVDFRKAFDTGEILCSVLKMV